MQIILFVTVADEARPGEIRSALSNAGHRAADVISKIGGAPAVDEVYELGDVFRKAGDVNLDLQLQRVC